ncbi:STAS domain-containing protein [Magnetospirillum fulvum]|uniref:Anti-anti-sigma factor n=1 Tax=Magnetospirillum fulvum TaxID=1082 RepID=A0A1H6I3Z9_MAGFU|nr:STAS domain-containing protein [Magnetospirillum fulvum]SEH43308.1 anti-anti-sigma factor [Magnetospirillum fulvum]
MKITVDEKKGGTNVLLDGVLDFSASAEFKKLVQRLSSSRDKALSFDLARVSRIDSVGLGLLHIAREELSDECRRVRLLSPQGGVLRMLELTEACNDFDIVP